MAIGTDAAILFFGTQDTVTSTGGAISDGSIVSAGTWTNDDDAPYASFVLHATFTTTMPTIGSLELLCRLQDIQSTNDESVVDANYTGQALGAFPIDFGETAGTEFWSVLANVELPVVGASQIYEFYVRNNNTGQTVTANWELYATPFTLGPHA